MISPTLLPVYFGKVVLRLNQHARLFAGFLFLSWRSPVWHTPFRCNLFTRNLFTAFVPSGFEPFESKPFELTEVAKAHLNVICFNFDAII